MARKRLSSKRFQRREPVIRHRINDKVRAPEIRLVDAEGELLGVMPPAQALEMARERGVDLVEISPKAQPPVCKLIDYGKMLYQLKKKEHQNKVASKAQEMKGIRLTFRIGQGDLDRQREHAVDFLQKNHPVRIQMIMKGRENAHKDLAKQKVLAFIDSLQEYGKLEQDPKPQGHQIIAIIKPLKKN